MMWKKNAPSLFIGLRPGTNVLISTNLKPDVHVPAQGQQQNNTHGYYCIFWLLTLGKYLTTLWVFCFKSDIIQIYSFIQLALSCKCTGVLVFVNTLLGKGPKPAMDHGKLTIPGATHIP